MQLPHSDTVIDAASDAPICQPLFQELFSHPQLVQDLVRSASVEEFLDFLTGVTLTGRQLIDLCSRQFMAANGLGGVAAGQGVQPAEIARLQDELAARFEAFHCAGAVGEFVAYLRDFFDAFPFMAAFDVANPDCQQVNDESLARTFNYLSVLDLFRKSGKNIVEFCASNQLFSFIAGMAGHKTICTDIGGASAGEVYGFGAKIFLRNAFLGPHVINFHLDRTNLAPACALPWFKDGVDVIAVHGTFINAGQCIGGQGGPKEMKESVARVVNFLRPCVPVLQSRKGMLSLRHVVLFDGYSPGAKSDLSCMLKESIEEEFKATTILCGEDPFPSPWAEAHNGQFTYALVMQC
jgi:hypothetical protein